MEVRNKLLLKSTFKLSTSLYLESTYTEKVSICGGKENSFHKECYFLLRPLQNTCVASTNLALTHNSTETDLYSKQQ